MDSNHPERNLGFLLIETSRLLRRNFERRAKLHELTQIQWRALAHLARQEGINQTELAERLEIQPITMTRMLDRLTNAGWVERRPDPNDRRASRVYLTVHAQPLLEQMKILGAQTREIALAGLSPTEQSKLLDLLQRIKANLSNVPKTDPSS